MFDMGLSELILISVVGIIALGPEKLPDAMIKIAKMFNKMKNLLGEAKDSIDDQIYLDDIDKDMEKYKHNIKETGNEIMQGLDSDDDEEDYDNNYNENGEIIKKEKKKKKKKKKEKISLKTKGENSNNMQNEEKGKI